jgi:hypothetical protein
MILFLLAAAAALPTQADVPPPHTLFNPTPAAELREFAPDRPDVTESPYTVDPGHVQVELSLVEYALSSDRTTRTFDALPVNLKLGLLDNVDIQFVFTPYERQVTRDEGQRTVNSGFGDETLVRLKINLQGNDHEGVALGVMPFVKLPTGAGGLSNDHVEGGLILPLATELPGDFTLGAMLEADFVYHDESDDYGVDLVHSATLAHPIAGPLNGYVEYVGNAPRGAPAGIASRYQAIASAGLTYELRDDLILDLGARLGFSGDADRSAIFMGAATRF